MAHALDSMANIIQIYSHTLDNARTLANSLSKPVKAIDNLNLVTTEADVYLVSVKDDLIRHVASSTPDVGIWAHTSGSVPMSVFQGYKSRYGVFYPLQTFSKSVPVDMSRVPLFIEGSDHDTTQLLVELASSISQSVEIADSSRRQALHIAAVFACNFVNYMWIQASELLKDHDLDFKLLLPLLEETLNKIQSVDPRNAQTGPARRGDTGIIHEHLEKLSGEKEEIYRQLSQFIINRYSAHE